MVVWFGSSFANSWRRTGVGSTRGIFPCNFTDPKVGLADRLTFNDINVSTFHEQRGRRCATTVN